MNYHRFFWKNLKSLMILGRDVGVFVGFWEILHKLLQSSPNFCDFLCHVAHFLVKFHHVLPLGHAHDRFLQAYADYF